MKQKKHFSLGFTLLELLVVISIIGILMAIGLASFSNAQVKARDTKRVTDMKSFQNVYEQYKASTGVYGLRTDMDAGFSGGVEPDDPKAGQDYCVSINETNQTYTVCATVENTANGNSNAACTGLGGATTQYYCVRNLQ